MKNTFKIKTNILILAVIAIGFTGCCKEEFTPPKKDCKKESEKEGKINRLVITKTGFEKTPVSIDEFNRYYFSDNPSQLLWLLQLTSAKGRVVVEDIPTSEFLINFIAIQTKKNLLGKVCWSGSRFGEGNLDVYMLKVDGNAAVVGGIVTSDDWFFPKGYHVCFLVRDNVNKADEMNLTLFYSAEDDGSYLTPTSGFWNTGWYTLKSRIDVD